MHFKILLSLCLAWDEYMLREPLWWGGELYSVPHPLLVLSQPGEEMTTRWMLRKWDGCGSIISRPNRPDTSPDRQSSPVKITNIFLFVLCFVFCGLGGFLVVVCL